MVFFLLIFAGIVAELPSALFGTIEFGKEVRFLLVNVLGFLILVY
ncbi:MAG: hypothetical protein CM15mP109_09740 [Candidatus Dadabacteria bacterium]|nr:MAG: hypothetical protein CM15mP109_09740 [Candidatus Dadabacteria bacterium]